MKNNPNLNVWRFPLWDFLRSATICVCYSLKIQKYFLTIPSTTVGSWLTSAKVLCAWFCIDKKDSIFQMKGAWSPIGSSHAHILWDNFSSAMFIGCRISAVEHIISYCFWCQNWKLHNNLSFLSDSGEQKIY